MSIRNLEVSYLGTRRGLFWLALRSSILTVLTLGFYRFWMKTRLRRYYWSAISPGGVPLEYTGTGAEKLMGFLVAVVFMAFYIGVINLVLVFLSFSFLQNDFAAFASSFVGLIPIYFYARYRARRYIFARTRWRGLRFGVESAAWSYAWRAMLHWITTVLTLGFLMPRQVFWLEKFRTDRTWFGRARFHQEGNWKLLFPLAVHIYIGEAISVGAGIAAYFNPAFSALIPIGVVWFFIGVVYFQVASFGKLTRYKRLGNDITFQANPSTWRVLRIYFFGYFLIVVVLFTCLFLLIFVAALVFPQDVADMLVEGKIGAILQVSGAGKYTVYGIIGLFYFSFFILYGVLTQVFITLPVSRHYAQTLTISDSHHLAEIDQRPRDEMSEAEGFAEALDIGAAI